MLYRIRRGIFETNSSSTHSICLGKEDFNDKAGFLPGQVVTVSQGEFGWGVEYLYSASEKLSYIATTIMCHEGVPYTEVGYTETFRRLQEVVKDFCGAKLVYNPVIDGYIDHQSLGVLQFPDDDDEFRDLMLNLIFNKNSYIEISNDNM